MPLAQGAAAAPPALPVVAAFDFDGTLTRRDTLLPFLARALGWPRLLGALLVCSPYLAAYALRLLPNHVAKRRLLAATLAGRSTADLGLAAAQYQAHDLPGQYRSWTLDRLHWHQAQGHHCVMVSASLDVYLAPVAAQLGCVALLCTEMATAGGKLTGQMRTPNCHGEQKVLRLTAWLAERFGSSNGAAGGPAGGVELYAYGDTAGDKPMLRMADHAWYRGKVWTG